MEMIVIYDETGQIYYRAGGSIPEPVGLPFLRVVIPQYKNLTRIDVSGETPTPVFEDVPKSAVDVLQLNYDTHVVDQAETELSIEERLCTIELNTINL